MILKFINALVILTTIVVSCNNKQGDNNVNKKDTIHPLTITKIDSSAPSHDSLTLLVNEAIIKGKVLDKGVIEVLLKTKNGIEKILIDSTFRFRNIENHKISFFVKLNELTSSIRYGYVEMNLKNSDGMLEFLADSLEAINTSKESQHEKLLIRTSTIISNESKNIYFLEILSPYSTELFRCRLLRSDYVHIDSTGRIMKKTTTFNEIKNW